MERDDTTTDSTNTAPSTTNTAGQDDVKSGYESGPTALSNQYVALDLPQQDVVIYDRTNTQAWIQSNYAVPLPEAAQSK
jgi:hypothetical protein